MLIVAAVFREVIVISRGRTVSRKNIGWCLYAYLLYPNQVLICVSVGILADDELF